MLSAVAWTGSGGDLSWNNAANWSGNATPGQQDDVTIGNVGSTPITVSGAAVEIHSLNSSNSIEVTNTSFSLKASSTVNATFQVDARQQPGRRGGSIVGRGDRQRQRLRWRQVRKPTLPES